MATFGTGSGRTRRGVRAAATRAVATAAAAAGVATGVVACDGGPAPVDAVRAAVPAPTSLLPGAVTGPAGAQVLSALFTPLVAFDDEGRPYPVAAESVESNDGGRTWTVRLRPGYTFHDGEPVTATHYVTAWSYTAHESHGLPNHHQFSRIAGYDEVHPSSGEPTADTLSGLEVADERTFTVTLSEPFAEFASMLAAPAFYPLPSAAFDDEGRVRSGYTQAPIGNGPYQLGGQAPDVQQADRLVLHPAPDHPGPTPRLARLELLPFTRDTPPDAEGGTARPYHALRAGEVDVVSPVHTAQRSPVAATLGEVTGIVGQRFARHAAARVQYLAFPAHEQEYADPRVRRAVSLAMDRGALAATGREAGVAAAGASAAGGFAPPHVPGARADGCGDACAHDPQRARQLYEQAQGPDAMTVTYNRDGGHGPWLDQVCAQLSDTLGVACAAKPVAGFSELVQRLRDGADVGMVRLGWSMDYPSVHSYLEPLFASTGSANLYGYQNAEVDALLSAAATGGETRAREAYQRLRSVLAEELPAVPVWFDERTAAYAAGVTGVTFTRSGYLDLGRLAWR